MVTLRLIIAVVACVLVACTGGGSEDPTEPAPSTAMPDPCPGEGTEFDLGNPDVGGDFAEFTVDAGPVWVTARAFEHGGFLDPDVGRTAIWVGPIDDLPTYHERAATVPEATAETDVVEDTWSRLDLDPGAYWLWTSTGGDIAVKSCTDDGVTDAVRVGPSP